MIKFNKASISNLEKEYILDCLDTSILSGDGKYTMKVYDWFKNKFLIENMLLTTSGTTALEMASLLINLEQNDEVITPSFTFSSTVNAFLLRGARPVFCDIRKDTMNIDETKIENLVSEHTKAIYAVDYAGIPCAMDEINAIADKYNLFVIEDAAQSVGSKYKGRWAGTLAEFGCYSFHETKNLAMGEGGAIILNKDKYLDRAEIIREKGTNRRHVLKGWVDKYTWYDIGSSFLPSDILAALLMAQLDRYEELYKKRHAVWNIYHRELEDLERKGYLKRQFVPDYAEHNAHMYNILLPEDSIRTNLVAKLKEAGIMAYICYVPLHSSPMGKRLGYTEDDCPITEEYGKRCLRLPLHADMSEGDALRVTEQIKKILLK